MLLLELFLFLLIYLQSYLVVGNQLLKLVVQPLIKAILDFQLNGRSQEKPELTLFPSLLKEEYLSCVRAAILYLKRMLLQLCQKSTSIDKYIKYLLHHIKPNPNQMKIPKQWSRKLIQCQTKRIHLQKQQCLNLKISKGYN